MKYLLISVLSFLFIFSLAGCSGDRSQSLNILEAEPSDRAPNSRILIAYFAVAENSEVDAVSSSSAFLQNGEAKGYVRGLAEIIQDKTGGDLFSIQTSVDYPADIDDVIDYAAKEQKQNARPQITSNIENLDDYDVVYIGYPNWWYDLPMVMYSFFEENDFSGKTLIPFCTHNGSRFSGTIKTIQTLEPQAVVVADGFTVNFSRVMTSVGDVSAWIEKME